MARIHNAQLSPSKIELLRAWVPTQPWAHSIDTSTLRVVDAYRFDDPDGLVGIETHLLETADGRIVQVPLTYRGAPLDGGEPFLISTMEHSVLGTRWVYDACGDPVYVRALAATILTGGAQAALEFDDPATSRPVTIEVSGSGDPATAVPVIDSVTSSLADLDTVVVAGTFELTVLRILDVDRAGPPLTVTAEPPAAHTLTGIWTGQQDSVLLASVTPA